MPYPDFSRSIAEICAYLSRTLYNGLDQWKDAGEPDEDSGHPVLTPKLDPALGISKSSPFLFRESWAHRRKPGPRNRYEEVIEYSPGAIVAQGEDGTVYVAHRGTKDSKDWDVDAQIVPITLEVDGNDLGKIHNGFHRSYFSYESKIKAALVDLLQSTGIPPTAVIFSGHSLGGALSTINARVFNPSEWGFPDDIAYGALTFGSPQPGIQSFKDAFPDAHQRLRHIINNNDVVPKLPGAIGYCHVGEILTLQEDLGGLGANHSLDEYAEKIDEVFLA
ncbi:MAG: lipase family protein [Verrucomicrobiota bacterium]